VRVGAVVPVGPVFGAAGPPFVPAGQARDDSGRSTGHLRQRSPSGRIRHPGNRQGPPLAAPGGAPSSRPGPSPYAMHGRSARGGSEELTPRARRRIAGKYFRHVPLRARIPGPWTVAPGWGQPRGRASVSSRMRSSWQLSRERPW